MVLYISRRQIAPREDPHDWNSWAHYLTIHESRLRSHPFVEGDNLTFRSQDEEGLRLLGTVQCQKNVLLAVRKWYDTRYSGTLLRVRGRVYVYVAWLPGEHLLLKYHNLHRDRDEYHHRVYDPLTGEEVFHEILERYQFPVMTEVLDELQVLTRDL